MPKYWLTIERQLSVITNVEMEGTDGQDAAERFYHQLEQEQCGAVEDDAMWGEIFYYQIAKAGPYTGTYTVLDSAELLQLSEEQ